MTRPRLMGLRVGRVVITAGHSGSGIIGYGVRHIVGRSTCAHRTNAGRVMTRPYPTHVRGTFPNNDDTMHMVRHHHEFPDIHMRHVFRYRIPTLLGQNAYRGWMHHAIRNVPEPMASVNGTYRQVVRTLLGVIVSRPSDGVAFRLVGHGIPNIGIPSLLKIWGPWSFSPAFRVRDMSGKPGAR